MPVGHASAEKKKRIIICKVDPNLFIVILGGIDMSFPSSLGEKTSISISGRDS
jgi:hypothetical protein